MMLLASLLALAAPGSAATCPLPKLDFSVSKLDLAAQAQFTENFRAAYGRACAEGLMADEPFIDPGSHDRSLLYVMNASEANVTSIYFGPSAAPPAMLMESPLVTPDGAVNLPTADDLHEAIYCWMVGATEAEEVESGRCLPD